VNKIGMAVSSEYGSTTETAQVNLDLTVATDASSEDENWDIPAAGESFSYRGFDIPVRTCTMARATIAETVATDPTARGPKFISLTFEIEPDGGIRPLTDAERT